MALGESLTFTVTVMSNKQLNVLQSFNVSYDTDHFNAIISYSFSSTSSDHIISVLLNNETITEISFILDSTDYSSIRLSAFPSILTHSTEPSDVQAVREKRDIASVTAASFILILPIGVLLSPDDISAHSSASSSLLLPPASFSTSLYLSNTILVTPITPIAGEYAINLFIHNVLFRADVHLTVRASSLSSQYLFWGEGMLGGRTTDTLLVQVKKTDAFGNKLCASLSHLMSSSMDDLSLTAETASTSAAVTVFKTPFSDYVQFSFQHTQLSITSVREQLLLNLEDDSVPCALPLPLDKVIIHSSALSLQNSVITVESQVHVGDEVLLSLSPRDVHGNLISPENVSPFINITVSNLKTQLVVMSTIGPYTRAVSYGNIQPYLFSEDGKTCVFLFSFLHSGEFTVSITATGPMSAAGAWSRNITVLPGPFDPQQSYVEMDNDQTPRLITNSAFTEEMATYMRTLGVELTNDILIRNTITTVVAGVQFMLHTFLLDISFVTATDSFTSAVRQPHLHQQYHHRVGDAARRDRDARSRADSLQRRRLHRHPSAALQRGPVPCERALQRPHAGGRHLSA